MSKESIHRKVIFAYRHMASVAMKCAILSKSPEACQSELESLKYPNPVHRLTAEEVAEIDRTLAIELGFDQWTVESGTVYLIPMALIAILPHDTELTSIFGTKATIAEITEQGITGDKDGSLPFGFMFPEAPTCGQRVVALDGCAYTSYVIDEVLPDEGAFCPPGHWRAKDTLGNVHVIGLDQFSGRWRSVGIDVPAERAEVISPQPGDVAKMVGQDAHISVVAAEAVPNRSDEWYITDQYGDRHTVERDQSGNGWIVVIPEN